MKRCKECGFVNLRHFFLHVVAQMKRQPQVIMAGLCEKLYRLKPALREVSPLGGGSLKGIPGPLLCPALRAGSGSCSASQSCVMLGEF